MRKIKNPKKYWKALAWKAFSVMIRKSKANHHGFGVCVTCPPDKAIKPWRELQAGHFVAGRNNSVLFDERLVWSQCSFCNVILKGNPIQYFLFMKSLGYTDEQLKEFDNLKHQIKPMSANDYKEIYERYKSWLK